MFGSKKQSVIPRNAPLTAFESARVEWHERYGSAIVDKSRWFVCTILLFISVLVLTFVILRMMPLKTVVPYVVSVADNGQVSVSSSAAQVYSPGQAEKTFFVATWVQKLMTLDQAVTERNLLDDYGFTSGTATQQFDDWIRQEKPIEALRKNPDLIQVAKVVNVNYLADDLVNIRVSTEKRSGNNPPDTKIYIVSVHFTIVPPKSEAAILQNPLGLFITRFDISEELSR